MGPNDDLHRLERELERSHKQGIGPLLLGLAGQAMAQAWPPKVHSYHRALLRRLRALACTQQ